MEKRVFLAIDLPREIIGELKKYRDRSLNVRWTRPENLHVTVNFLGNLKEEKLAELYEACERACSHRPNIHLAVDRILPYRHMIWVSLKKNRELEKLHHELNDEFTRLGIEQNLDRNFRPHINLARLYDADITGAYKPKELFNLNFTATHVVLFESILRSEGPTYISLEAFELKG